MAQNEKCSDALVQTIKRDSKRLGSVVAVNDATRTAGISYDCTEDCEISGAKYSSCSSVYQQMSPVGYQQRLQMHAVIG